MALNVGLSASARIELLDSLLRHDRYWTKEELLREICNHTRALRDKDVSDATLRNDLDEIRIRAGENLEESTKGKKKAFRYTDRTFSIYSIPPLDPEDYDFLQQAIRLLQQVKGFAISEELKTVLIKLKDVIPVEKKRPAILFDGPDRVEGIEILQEVFDAINNEQVIGFKYQPFTANAPYEVTLHPYLLRQYNNRWFLVGHDEEKQEIRLYPLDRFKNGPKARPKIVFKTQQETGFDPVTYFEHVVGVTLDKKAVVEEIHLKISAGRYPYIFTKPIHGSQQLLKTYQDGSVLLKLNLKINKELLGVILSFGSDVQVMKPASLKEQIREMAQKILDKYQ
jgi:predicted DNA-binding transcriptional regulator YafY